MTRSRLEAFSDGVFAVAITLLVLNLIVPSPAHTPAGGLLSALGREWESWAAFLLSFIVIGIIWINHHSLLGQAETVDRVVMLANLSLLFWVVTIPFVTQLIAGYLGRGGANAHLAMALYSAVMFAMGGSFSVLFWALIRVDRRAGVALDPVAVRRARTRFGAGGVVYVITIGLSFVSAPAALAAHFATAIYYLFDQIGAGPDRPHA